MYSSCFTLTPLCATRWEHSTSQCSWVHCNKYIVVQLSTAKYSSCITLTPVCTTRWEHCAGRWEYCCTSPCSWVHSSTVHLSTAKYRAASVWHQSAPPGDKTVQLQVSTVESTAAVPPSRLCTLYYLFACQVRVAIGNSGLCCCLFVWRLSSADSLVCWFWGRSVAKKIKSFNCWGVVFRSGRP